MAEETEKSVELQIKFRIPQRMPALLATEMIVQPGAGGVTLSFFDVIAPIVPPDVSEEQLESIRQAGIPAECISRIFIPAYKFEGFVNAMVTILKASEAEAEPTGAAAIEDVSEAKEGE